MSHPKRPTGNAVARLLPLLFLAGLSFAQSGEGDVSPTATTINFPNLVLIDQDGHKVNFYNDLVKDKVVAINFIFTTCPTICPPMGANFGKLQERLGKHEERGINLISVSVDPSTDTPRRLKTWSAQFGAAPGWTLLTGEKRDVDTLLKAMNAFSADFTSHSPTVLVGNDKQGRWTRANGLASPASLQKVIESMVAKPTEATPGSNQ